MDEKDKQILNMIRNDARMSYQEIGDKLGMISEHEVRPGFELSEL